MYSRIVRKIALICGVFILSMTAYENGSLMQLHVAESEAYIIRQTKIKWRYKKVDGVLYKRGYNEKTNEWVTDWIKVG